jgi:hypothetical protein
VLFLGAHQNKILDRFSASLASTSKNESSGNGFILGGEFGTGKSHMLHYLKQKALEDGFAVSLVVISKETPLSDLDMVYKAAIRELRLPDRQGGDLNEVVLRLDRRDERYAAFYEAVVSPDRTLDPLFAATLLIFERLSGNDPLLDAVQAFWAGSRINVSDVKKALKFLGEAGSGLSVKPRKADELAPMRFSFTSQLIRAAGYNGWLLLVDEVELVAKLSLRSRARSYANLAWMLGLSHSHIPYFVSVAAATQDFTTEILQKKQDDVNIPLKIGARDPALAARAEHALRVIDESSGAWQAIVPQSDSTLDDTFVAIKGLYRDAFDWSGRAESRPPYAGVTRSMRMHVREWITRWDLERLDPNYAADIESEALRPDLAEREGLDGLSETDEGDSND